MPQVAGIRRMGAAALDLAYVAAGRFDAFWEEGLKPWDCAAGILLVKEAGGFVVPISAKQDPFKTGSMIATNEGIHTAITDLIRGA
jgi:myo-inositol-1(or 4)-monophosphatase